jgi:hypothetical protein
MMILVRALIATTKVKGEQFRLEGKIFPIGTPIDDIREYANTLITEMLNSLEIKIIKNTEGLIEEIPIETSREPKKPTEGKITEVKWQGEDFF